MGPKEIKSLPQLVEYRAEKSPDTVAYRFLDSIKGKEPAQITYAELASCSKQIAYVLKQNGLKKGDRILINHLPGLGYIISFFACMYSRGIAVPIYPPRFNSRLDRINSILEDSGAELALTSSVIKQSMDLSNEDRCLKKLKWLETDSYEVPNEKFKDNKTSFPDEDELAFLQYTSGSTSVPKGVMLTHKNLLSNLECIREKFEMKPEVDQGVIWLPPYHDMGLIGGILTPLYVGFPVNLMSPFTFLQRPFRWLEAITKYRGTISGGPNFAFDQLTRRIREDLLDSLDLCSWRVAFCGAEPIHKDIMDQFAKKFARCGFKKKMFFPCYGLAESTLIVTGGQVSKGLKLFRADKNTLEAKHLALETIPSNQKTKRIRNIVSCGKVIAGHDLKIVDPKTKRLCNGNQVGEIWVSGSSIAKGYWNLPEQTKESFQASYQGQKDNAEYLRTGDFGFVKDNEVYITGRLKDILIIHGRNYYPQDIELSAQKSHRYVRSGGAAFSISSEKEELLAIVCEIERRVKEDELDEVLKAIESKIFNDHGLNTYSISLVKPYSIPLTSSGKVMRNLSRKQYLAGQLEEIKRKIL